MAQTRYLTTELLEPANQTHSLAQMAAPHACLSRAVGCGDGAIVRR